MLLRLINLYNSFLFYIKYFLYSAHFFIIKFSVTLESIIVFLIFLLMLILIYSWVFLVEAASWTTKTVLQYSFWLLLSEESNSFSAFPEDIFFGCIADYLDKILYIFCVRSGSYRYPLYKIAIISVCSLWLNFLNLGVFSSD